MKSFEEAKKTMLHRLQIVKDDTVLPELVLNDVLFAHSNPAASTRFRLAADGEIKTYRTSNGLLTCTAAGSTAWMYQLKGHVMLLDSPRIQYLVRDVREESPQFTDTALTIHSLCREGMLYIDGEHLKYPAGLGSTVRLEPGRPLTIVGDLKEKRKISKQCRKRGCSPGKLPAQKWAIDEKQAVSLPSSL